jgi:hypothetical protein
LLTITLTGIRGLAQETGEKAYLPVVFKPNGEPAPTKTATPTSTATSTPTATATSTATATPTDTSTTTLTPSPTTSPIPDCDDFSFSNFEIRQYNRPAAKITNSSGSTATIVQFRLDWESAQAWAGALGYDDIHVDWFKWNGARFYEEHDYDHPTVVTTTVILEAATIGDWEIDFD